MKLSNTSVIRIGTCHPKLWGSPSCTPETSAYLLVLPFPFLLCSLQVSKPTPPPRHISSFFRPRFIVFWPPVEIIGCCIPQLNRGCRLASERSSPHTEGQTTAVPCPRKPGTSYWLTGRRGGGVEYGRGYSLEMLAAWFAHLDLNLRTQPPNAPFTPPRWLRTPEGAAQCRKSSRATLRKVLLRTVPRSRACSSLENLSSGP